MSDELTRATKEIALQLDRLNRTILEAVRALKPAPSSDRFDAGPQLYAANQEIDRMNRVIADQALTIGALKDENARSMDARIDKLDPDVRGQVLNDIDALLYLQNL